MYRDDYHVESDDKLIKPVLEGDHEAFAGLISRHQLKVIGFCFSMLGNEQMAEDAAQEIFVKAFVSLPHFRGRSSFSTWLYRIAYNHCCNIRIKSARSRQESMDSMSEVTRENAYAQHPRKMNRLGRTSILWPCVNFLRNTGL